MVIVSHIPPRHMDDFLAISVCLGQFSGAQVKYVHPQQVPQEYLEDPNVLVVDVGMTYDQSMNNFDHHQSSDVPASIVLVARKFFPRIIDTQFIRGVDLGDRFGPSRVQMNERDIYKIITLLDPAVVYPAVVRFLNNLDSNLSMDEGLKLLYREIQLSFPNEIKRVKVQIAKESERFKKLLNSMEIKEVDGIAIGVSSESFGSNYSNLFQTTRMDILIEQNRLNNSQTSIIVNTSSPQAEAAYTLADKLSQDAPITFIHPTKFLRVVDMPVETFARMRL